MVRIGEGRGDNEIGEIVPQTRSPVINLVTTISSSEITVTYTEMFTLPDCLHTSFLRAWHNNILIKLMTGLFSQYM